MTTPLGRTTTNSPRSAPQVHAASQVLRRLSRTLPAETYLTGGALRDQQCGRIPKDYDLICVTPQTVKQLMRTLRRAGFNASTGGAHQVTRLHSNNINVEISVTHDLQADLAERDLTINALYRRLDSHTVHDPFGALESLRHGELKLIGVPSDNLIRSPRHALRAARISAELQLDLDQSSRCALGIAADQLNQLVPEVQWAELQRILTSPDPRGFHLLRDHGLLARLLPRLHAINSAQWPQAWSGQPLSGALLQLLPDHAPQTLAALSADLAGLHSQDEPVRQAIQDITQRRSEPALRWPPDKDAYWQGHLRRCVRTLTGYRYQGRTVTSTEALELAELQRLPPRQ